MVKYVLASRWNGSRAEPFLFRRAGGGANTRRKEVLAFKSSLFILLLLILMPILLMLLMLMRLLMSFMFVVVVSNINVNVDVVTVWQ